MSPGPPEGRASIELGRALRKGTDMLKTDVTRRNLVKGAALGAVAVGAVAAGTALADEAAASEYTYADTVKWDAEYDVVVLGIGFAGMAAAIAAADAGANVLICEKADEGESGGNSKVCAQFFIDGNGDADACLAYFKALAADRETPEDVLKVYADGIANMGQILADRYGFNPDEYADYGPLSESVALLSPEYPEFEGSDKIVFRLTHNGYGDSFAYQTLKSCVQARSAQIDVWFETPGTALIQDPMSKTIIGVTVDRRGEARNVRALNGVCVCTGGFENDFDMQKEFLDIVDCRPCGTLVNTGDGIKMCQAVGARLWHMGAYERDCVHGLGATGFWMPEGSRAAMPSLGDNKEMCTGACIMVGTWGRRFLNECTTSRHGHIDMGNGAWENPRFPEKFWAIYDQAQMDLINAAGLIPASQAASVMQLASLSELAAGLEIPEENLAETLEHWNFFAEQGCDYDFGRAPETIRAFEGDTYYAIRLQNSMLNTQGGPERNANAEIVGLDGNPIPHLYGAGECGGITSYMYQGGGNSTECYIFGEIAGRNAAAVKDPLPAYVGAVPVESAPKHVGEETDLVEEILPEGGDGLLVGNSSGMGGTVALTVTLDDEGKIASVEVTRQNETPDIGGAALEVLPDMFVGLSTAEEIDAVDAVSGATVTTNAVKAAIKKALGLE